MDSQSVTELEPCLILLGVVGQQWLTAKLPSDCSLSPCSAGQGTKYDEKAHGLR